MTLAAVKKLAMNLPPHQRMQLADALQQSIPLLPGSAGIEELERRADEVLSGKVKGIAWEEVERDMRKLERSLKAESATAASAPARRSPRQTARRSA